MDLILTGSLGGVWGFGMAELFHKLQNIFKEQPKKIQSDLFKMKLKDGLEHLVYIYIWFFIILILIVNF